MGYVGEMRPRTTARTRHCTIAGSAGQTRGLHAHPVRTGRARRRCEYACDRRDAPEGPSDGSQSEAQKGGQADRLIGLTMGGRNTKLHAVKEASGHLIRLLLTAGHVSDYNGAKLLLDGLPSAKHLLADRGYDAN